LLALAGALVAISTSLSVGAQELGVEPNVPESTTPDVVAGKELASRLCAGCHAIDTAATERKVDVPSFVSIADRPGQSFDALSGWLMAPHMPMPDPHLSRKEIRDLAGYIVSLKRTP
jgi:mono/diheme cytochrome c family protein